MKNKAFALFAVIIFVINLLILTNTTQAAEPTGYLNYNDGTGCPSVCSGPGNIWWECVGKGTTCFYEIKCTCTTKQ